jgi:hypothetical protein
MKNTAALTRERWAPWSVAGARPLGLSPRWTVADAGPRGLSPRQLLWAALTGEIFAAAALFASGNVPPILVRSLQLFLRF